MSKSPFLRPLFRTCVLGYHQVMKCDLGELESVRAFAREFEAKHGSQLDVLVNNGEMRSVFGVTNPRAAQATAPSIVKHSTHAPERLNKARPVLPSALPLQPLPLETPCLLSTSRGWHN